MNSAIIVAGGSGSRFSKKKPKQFFKINGREIFAISIETFLKHPKINEVIIVSHKDWEEYIQHQFPDCKIVLGGKRRQDSVYNGLCAVSSDSKNVLIHDAARPFCTNKLIKKILIKLKHNNNCIPFVEYNDRQINKTNKKDEKVINIQTPQGFDYKLIYNAHIKFKKERFSDDARLIQKLNLKINLLKGEKENIKITYPEDLVYFNLLKKPTIRSGIGYDIHKIDKKTKNGLKLCGVKLPFSKLIGHSDADVGLHAICDSIFGALSMRDIGYYFPNTKSKWKNADSSTFIIYCKKKLIEKGYYITNLDINIIAEKPKINTFVTLMKKRISNLLNIEKNIISIKATTNEKIGFIGNGEGIAAEAIVQISNENIN